ncbi:MAG: aldolase [Rhodobacteraceae bacterium]|nr:aldolase [Paracoccaceae bacterium]MBL4812857.1 aldolase [Paracoccaceae bacterium]
MQIPKPAYSSFRKRLKSQDHLLGTFVKTPTTHATEMLGLLGFDFVVFDQEHAPLGHDALDRMILAGRASNIASIVRVGDPSESNILSVLDCGASGVLVPHVSTVEKAEHIVACCRYRAGHRGFANTTRAGGFGSVSFSEHMDTQDAQVSCIAMIEDVDALDEIEGIVAVEGLDAIFIGRGDLTAAIGAPSMTSAETHEIVKPIMQAARNAGLPIIMLCPNRKDAVAMTKLGASAFLISSDHGFMRSAATAALTEFAGPIE